MIAQWFWFGLMIACVLWYSVITLYVGIKGAQDIRGMFGRLASNRNVDSEIRKQ